MVVKDGEIEQAGVLADRYGFRRVPRELPRSRAELAAQAGDPVGPPSLLPDDTVVITGAGRARGVVDELLEVVRIRVAAFLEGHGRASIRIAVDPREIARKRILAAERQLAQFVAFKADPGIAVEQHPRSVHLTCIQHELAFELENDARPIGPKAVFAGNSPAVAAEPRDLIRRLFITLGVGVSDVAERDVEQAVKGHGVGGSYLKDET